MTSLVAGSIFRRDLRLDYIDIGVDLIGEVRARQGDAMGDDFRDLVFELNLIRVALEAEAHAVRVIEAQQEVALQAVQSSCQAREVGTAE